MRTKNFNLKKKIAFIASVTMIATTAAYLPAEVAQNIGIGSGIVASAETKATYENDEAGVADIFTAYIKVNGKYIDKDGNTYNKLADATAELVTVNLKAPGSNLTLADTVDKSDTDTTKVYKSDKTVPSPYNDKLVVNKDNSIITLPTTVAPGSTVVVEVAADVKDKAAAVTSSTNSVEATLDEYGKAEVAEKSKAIEVTGDNLTKNDDGIAIDGDKETVDFSGLKFAIADDEKTPFTPKGTKAISAKSGEATGTFAAVSEAATNPTADSKSYDYQFVASGNVWARNYVATLGAAVSPGDEIVVDLGVNTNWTVTGTGVKDGKLTLKMGDNGVVSSGLITFSKSGEKSEYYVLTVKNAKSGIDATKISTGYGQADPSTVIAYKDNESGETKLVAAGEAKVTHETNVQTVGSSREFVEVYTIALNKKTEANVQEEFSFKYDDESVTVKSDSNDSKLTSNNNVFKVKNEAGKGVNYTSPVIVVTKNGETVGNFQLIFTNEYEIKLDDQNSSTKEDGTVKVVGTKVTAPADTHLGGYTFAGWKNGNAEKSLTKPAGNTDKVVFTKGNTIQQSEAITPNTTLYAYYTANNYTVELDANGGKFETLEGFTKTKVNDDNVATAVSKATEADNDDITAYTDTTKLKAVKDGYSFVGWALKADATEDDVLDAEAYNEAKPETTNGSLKLYAVWEADENLVSFMMFTDPEANEAEDDSYENTAVTKAKDANGEISSIKVVSGDAYGELPTPVLKGYKFVGWFKRDAGTTEKDDNKLVAVTASTKLDGTKDEITAGSTLYAKFTQNTYKVTVDLDGGKVPEDKDIASFKIKYDNSKEKVVFLNSKGDEITDDVNATDTGKVYEPTKGTGEYYKFEGWKINGSTQNYVSTKIEENILAMKEVGDVELKAVYEVIETAKANGYIALEANGGTFYTTTVDESGNVTKYEKATEFNGFSGKKNDKITETVKNNVVTTKVNSADVTYTVSRPGYTFTGWYSDADCTTAYTFDKYPDGKEVTVYAGWKANASTRYKIHFNLVNANGAFVTAKDFDENKDADANEFSYTQTYMATTGSTVKASDKEFTYDGKTYVYDPVLSSAYNTEDEVKAEYKAGSAKTESAAAVDGLVTGKFIIDSSKYTTIQGFYVEKGSEHKELGTATNVAVKDGTVTWTAADNADHYRIQKTVNGKTYYGAKVTAAKATYTVPVEEHEIAVVAYNADESEKTVSTVVKVAASTKLGKATNVKCAEDGTVTFSAATGATKYQVAKIVNGNTYYSAKSDATSIKISPATEDYEVYVIAFDSTGKLSTHSETIKVPAAASTLEAVDDSTITVDGDGKVTWTAAKGAVAYKVFKITKNSEGKEVTNWGSKVTTTSYTFKNLPKTDYKVYVAAIDANGNVKYSAKKKISSLPAATNVKLSSDKMTVSWTAPTGTNADKIVKYQVAKFDTAANKTNYSVKVDAPATSITMRNAAVAGTKIFVLAFDADGNSSYSASIDVK